MFGLDTERYYSIPIISPLSMTDERRCRKTVVLRHLFILEGPEKSRGHFSGSKNCVPLRTLYLYPLQTEMKEIFVKWKVHSPLKLDVGKQIFTDR